MAQQSKISDSDRKRPRTRSSSSDDDNERRPTKQARRTAAVGSRHRNEADSSISPSSMLPSSIGGTPVPRGRGLPPSQADNSIHGPMAGAGGAEGSDAATQNGVPHSTPSNMTPPSSSERPAPARQQLTPDPTATRYEYY